MKYLVLVVAVIALGWLGFSRYLANTQAQAEKSIAVASRAPAVKAAPTPAVVLPSPAIEPLPVSPQPKEVPQAATLHLSSAAPNPEIPIKIDLTEALGPDNHYHDAALGLNVTLPAGWTVRDAIRWGDDHKQNTVFLKPDLPTSASPSMYYKPYTPEEAASFGSTGAAALLREQAQKKEASRMAGVPDYKNVADSFSFFDVDGSPAMSYFATFTRGDQVMTEHFIRVLSPNGYVMFFTTGKFEDVKALMPQLKQAASTVKGP